MLEFIKEREHITEEYYTLDFDNDSSGGFTFPCDENGTVDMDSLQPAAVENLKWCLSNKEKFIFYGLVIHHRKYTVPALVKCKCGETFSLENEYMGACECPKCGQWYNLFGQELINPRYWEDNEDIEEY